MSVQLNLPWAVYVDLLFLCASDNRLFIYLTPPVCISFRATMATAPYNYSYIFKYIIIGKWTAMPVICQWSWRVSCKPGWWAYMCSSWCIDTPLPKEDPPGSISNKLYATQTLSESSMLQSSGAPVIERIVQDWVILGKHQLVGRRRSVAAGPLCTTRLLMSSYVFVPVCFHKRWPAETLTDCAAVQWRG